MLIIGINNNKKDLLLERIKKLDKNAFIYINETVYLQNGFIK